MAPREHVTRPFLDLCGFGSRGGFPLTFANNSTEGSRIDKVAEAISKPQDRILEIGERSG